MARNRRGVQIGHHGVVAGNRRDVEIGHHHVDGGVVEVGGFRIGVDVGEDAADGAGGVTPRRDRKKRCRDLGRGENSQNDNSEVVEDSLNKA